MIVRHSRLTMQPAHTSLADRVYAALREAISSGEYLPGAHLVENELTRKYRVSRATVREVLRRLLAENLVQHIAHHSVRVRKLTVDEVIEIYTVREPIEALAARLAAQTPAKARAGLGAIHREAGAAVRSGDAFRFARLNSRFHSRIAEMTGNHSLAAVLARLNTPLIGYQFLSVDRAIDIHRAHEEHAAVLSAITAGDPAAAETAMRRHLQRTRDSIIRSVTDRRRGAGGARLSGG